MPGNAYWIRHFLLAVASIFLFLLVVELIKGRRWQDGALAALAWAPVAAAIFIGARHRNARKGIACALCEDLGADAKKENH